MSTIAQQTMNIQAMGMAGMAEFGALIKRAREEKGMTLEEAGRHLGRPHTYLGRIENGRNSNPPDPESFRAIWRLFDLSPRSLLIALGYLDADEAEPGIAYTVAEGTTRANLLALLRDASDADVAAVIAIVQVILKSYSARGTGAGQSGRGAQSDRSA